MTEEMLGQMMLERARMEGHKPAMPTFTGRKIEYRRTGKGLRQSEAAEARYRALTHMTRREVAMHLGVGPDAVRRASKKYRLRFAEDKH